MRETLYGRHAVHESLRAGRRTPYQLLVSEGIVSVPIIDEILALARVARLRIEEIPRTEMDRIVGHEQHQGVALEASEYPYADIYDMLDLAQERREPPLLLLLDLVQDVQNLGTLIRTAEAVGAHGIVIQERRAAGITPDTVSTSSGAVEHMLIAQVTNLAQEIARLKDAEVWIAGLEEVYGAQIYTEIDLTVPLGLVVGNEAQGLRRLVRERCDWMLRLPMVGKIDSLNAAVAGSVALYEVFRQRRLVS
ncbi:MAG: 23S rRNA (guanosine(2251)-2'-O)-methyltransferase RlmB [Anaerolineae bacterium]